MAFSGSLNFISASDVGQATYAGSNVQYAWTYADFVTSTNIREFIPVDFVGLNTIIKEEMHFSPTGEGSANLVSASQMYSAGGIIGSKLTGSVLNFAHSWPANGAFGYTSQVGEHGASGASAAGILASQATVFNSKGINVSPSLNILSITPCM